jgi:hypothetical protein
MTVNQLIELLQDCNGDAEVYIPKNSGQYYGLTEVIYDNEDVVYLEGEE